jgi:protein-S-isoprenylcysteine O-methyltransferase Ste14
MSPTGKSQSEVRPRGAAQPGTDDGTHLDNAGVIAIPPFIYLAFMLVGLVFEFLFPMPLLPQPVQYWVGFVLIGASLATVPVIAGNFRRSGTTFDVRGATTTVVTDGLHRFSRNPGYVAMTVLYIGIAIAIDGIWVLVALVPAALVLHYGVVLREEHYLTRKFGEEYLRYKRSVRRWI